MAAVISRGSRARFLLWFVCIHDFESYPSDRELGYDFARSIVMLLPRSPHLIFQIFLLLNIFNFTPITGVLFNKCRSSVRNKDF